MKAFKEQSQFASESKIHIEENKIMEEKKEAKENSNDENNDKNEEEKEKSTKELFIEAVKDMGDRSTLNPVAHVTVTEHLIVRVIYSLCFLVSFGYMLFTIVQLFQLFFQYTTNVQLSIGADQPVQFPAVTICNLNPIYLDSASDYTNIANILIANNLSYAVNSSSGNSITSSSSSNDISGTLTNILDVIRRAIYTNTSLTDNDKKQFGFALDNYMLISCKFNDIPCTEKNFSWFWSYDFGNCYTFNSGINYLNQTLPVWNTSLGGSSYGLQMELIVGDPDNMAYSSTSGLYVAVHNKSTNIKAQALFNGVNVGTGRDTFVSIHKTFTYKLPSPYSNCLDTWTGSTDYAKTLYGYITSNNISTAYDQLICQYACQQDTSINNCSCMDPELPPIKSVSYCRTQAQYNCLKGIYNTFSSSDINVLCQNACPLACTSISYDLRTFTATYPTDYYVTLLNSSTNFLKVFPLNDSSKAEYVSQSLLKIAVNYKDLDYDIVSETPALNEIDFIGVLSGQLCLFVGATFLTFAEGIEFGIEFILLAIKIRKKNKKENEEKEKPIPLV